MSAKKKTVFKGFDYRHCDDFAKYLMDMAAKGWHFKEWGTGLIFEKGEPENAVYAVEVFTDASEYDLRPEPHTKAFAEYCEAAGWKLIDAKQKFVIFKKIQDDAVPILTSEERLNNVCKENRFRMWTNLIGHGSLLAMAGFDLFGSVAFEMHIFSSGRLLFFLFWVAMFAESLYEAISFGVWKRNCKKLLGAGEELYFGDKKSHWFKKFPSTLFLIAALVFAWCLNGPWTFYYIAGLLAVLVVFAIVMNKFRPDADTHYILQTVLLMVIFVAVLLSGILLGGLVEEDHKQTEAPLLKTDYTECATPLEDITLYEEQNVFGQSMIYIISYEDTETDYNNGISYYVFTSEYDWILNRIWDKYADTQKDLEVIEYAQEWGAKAAYHYWQSRYIVRYENCILLFNDYSDIALTQEQIDIIRDKLDLR